MIVTSFATPEYLADIERLALSCDKFGLRRSMGTITDHGSWKDNCCKKPDAILGVMIKFRCPVVWMDADTEIMKLPVLLFQGGHDFAAYNWNAEPDTFNPSVMQCSGGVLYFGYTAPAIELLIRWQNQVRDPEINSDDQALDFVFNQARPPVNPLWLPKAYNRMDALWPEVTPVINHYYTRGQRYQGNANDCQVEIAEAV